MSKTPSASRERGSPGAAEATSTKRRLAIQHVREARDRLTSTSGTRPVFDYELLRQFAQNRLSGSLVIMLLVITIGLLGFCLYEWLSNNAYGVNNNDSLIYMGAMYVLALVIYLVARYVRGRQGIDLSLINKEIPVE